MTSERRELRYRVAAVERMTGIPASTLRSWERRHGWPRPSGPPPASASTPTTTWP
ncbi:MAG TPA: MerR family transcriptional regulator [Actinomycetes bacterium]|nr:MerR family transcriptional regulator [Actinomycetes bacterium]